jgi:hypothetical protein
MPVPQSQKTAIEEVITALLNVTQGGRYKRRLTDNFLDLPNKDDYPDYYKVIPKPRCISGIQQTLEKDEYDNCLAAFDDLHLVFLNALYYNEDDSQIAVDADKLRVRPALLIYTMPCAHRSMIGQAGQRVESAAGSAFTPRVPASRVTSEGPQASDTAASSSSRNAEATCTSTH